MLLGSYISQRYQNPLGARVREGYEPLDIGVEIQHWSFSITNVLITLSNLSTPPILSYSQD